MADDMSLPPRPKGGKNKNRITELSAPIFHKQGIAGSAPPNKNIATAPVLKKSFSKTPLSLQREKELADKLLTTQSNLQRKDLEINEIKEKSGRKLEEFRLRFEAQKNELKKELDTYKNRLAKEKEDWNKLIIEKESEVRRIRGALTGKDKVVSEKIQEAESEIKTRLNREYSRAMEEKKLLEKRNTELEGRLKELEGGWKRKEQEVRDLQEKALKELKDAEERLQEEREKTWLRTLRSKEDEINSLKVEINLQDSKLRSVLEKKQSELKEMGDSSDRAIREKSELINKEKEGILEALAGKEKEIAALKESYLDREKYFLNKVEEVEMDGKLALAKFDQELKEREKNLWVEREEWITVLKAQFKEKEKDLKESVEKEKTALKEREGVFGQEREKLLILLNTKDAEIKVINLELRKVLENRAAEMESLRREIAAASKIKQEELESIRKEYIRVIEGREKEIELLKSELRGVLAAKEKETAAAQNDAKARVEAKEKENVLLIREFLDKEAELRRRVSEYEARATEAVKKVVDNEELWKQRIVLKEAELADIRQALLRHEEAFKGILESKKVEVEEAKAGFLKEKEVWAEKIALKDYELSGEMAKKEQEISFLSEKIKKNEEDWTTRLEAQTKQFYSKLSEKDEITYKHMEENRALLLKLQAEGGALIRKEQEYRLFVSQFEEKERQFKKLVEDQVAVIRELEEERALEYTKSREHIRLLENTINEKDTEKRRLENELKAKSNVIFEREENIRELGHKIRQLEHDKEMLQEDLERSKAEIGRVKEVAPLEHNNLKQDYEKLQRMLEEKNSVIDNLRVSLGRLNEENTRVESEYNLENTNKLFLNAELERLRKELRAQVELSSGAALPVQLSDKETIIRSLNDTIVKVEKEKAAMKDLILEKSEKEEVRNKEFKEFMDSISNLTEDKNKLELKLAGLDSDRQTVISELSAAQSEIERLKNESYETHQAYELRLEAEKSKLAAALQKVKEETEEFKRLSSSGFDQGKNTLFEDINRLKAEVINKENVLESVKIENQRKLEEQRRKLEEEFNEKIHQKDETVLAFEERIGQLKEEIEKRDSELSRINGSIDTNLSRLEEQNRGIEELKKDISVAGENLRAAKEETLRAAELLKNKEMENQKLQIEMGGLVTRTEELSKVAAEKDARFLELNADLSGKIEALAEALKIKERDLETAKAKVSEFEKRIVNDYEMKEEELKLAISRLQMQMKEINNRYETEIKAEKQKIQSLQAEYALREVQWSSQKEKEKEVRGQMADMEATIARLNNDSEAKRKQFQAELENSASKIKEFESRVKVFEGHIIALEGNISVLENRVTVLDAENNTLASQVIKETEEKEKLLKKHSEIERKLKDLSVSLKGLRSRFKFVLWLWYPNEPR